MKITLVTLGIRIILILVLVFSIKSLDPAIFIIGRVLAIWPNLAWHLVRSGGHRCSLIVRYCTVTFLGFAFDTDRMGFLP